MEITINISGLKNNTDVMQRFNEVIEFGEHENGKPVGVGNWDAFSDCLRWLDEGGIYGTGRKVTFPCTLIIKRYSDFERTDPEGFAVLKEILEEKPALYKQDN